MASLPTTNQQKFTNLPDFQPHYTPREILELGVFGGSFFYKISSRKNLPADLFKGIPRSKWDNAVADANINYFKVLAYNRRRDFNIPIEVLVADHEGWFKWYCRMYYGRIMSFGDPLRVEQWRDELETIMFYVQQACKAQNKPLTDLTVEPYWRQQALQFGWDSTKEFTL